MGIIADKFVEPYRKGGKNDNNDAEASCEAVMRPNIWFVPVKSPEQQAVMCLHRARQSIIKERTLSINQLRGLLLEFGITIPVGRYSVHHKVPPPSLKMRTTVYHPLLAKSSLIYGSGFNRHTNKFWLMIDN